MLNQSHLYFVAAALGTYTFLTLARGGQLGQGLVDIVTPITDTEIISGVRL